MNTETVKLLACPLCQQVLMLDKEKQLLICHSQQLSYPIINGIPALLPEMAKPINQP